MWAVGGRRGSSTTSAVSGRGFHSMGQEMQGEVGTALSFACLPQMHSLPFYGSARCHGANRANPVSRLFLPTLCLVGPANGKHQQEVGGQEEGRSRGISLSPSALFRLCLWVPVATPRPSLPLQPWVAVAPAAVPLWAVSPTRLAFSFFPSSYEVCCIELPVMGCFSEWTWSNMNTLNLRCLYETLCCCC